MDRSRTAGPLLEWKVAMFLVAAGLGLGGMYLEERWLTAGAILLLMGGVLLRFPSKPPQGPETGEGEEEVDPGHHEDPSR